MKIAEISTFSKFSVGKIMVGIKNYINQNTSHMCKVFFARGENNDNECFKFGNNKKILLNCLMARVFDNDGFCFFSDTKKLEKMLIIYNPDVVHIHCLHGYNQNVEHLFKFFFNKKCKIVWTMHDTWAITGHCCFFNNISCDKWKKMCYSCKKKNEYPASFIFNNSKKNYIMKKKIFTSLDEKQLTIVSPSLWMNSIIKESFLSRYDLKIIYNGINEKKFYENNKITKENIILGVASVWDERKGLIEFFNLSKTISDDWHIILVGTIKEKLVLPKNITHIDRTTDQNELIKIYQKALVLYNPTKDDNYPTVNLEAQLCGCKVLTNDVGGTKETDCGNLYIVDKNKDVFEQIKEICKIKNNLINFYHASEIRMSKEYISLFEEVIKK